MKLLKLFSKNNFLLSHFSKHRKFLIIRSLALAATDNYYYDYIIKTQSLFSTDNSFTSTRIFRNLYCGIMNVMILRSHLFQQAILLAQSQTGHLLLQLCRLQNLSLPFFHSLHYCETHLAEL